MKIKHIKIKHRKYPGFVSNVFFASHLREDYVRRAVDKVIEKAHSLYLIRENEKAENDEELFNIISKNNFKSGETMVLNLRRLSLHISSPMFEKERNLKSIEKVKSHVEALKEITLILNDNSSYFPKYLGKISVFKSGEELLYAGMTEKIKGKRLLNILSGFSLSYGKKYKEKDIEFLKRAIENIVEAMRILNSYQMTVHDINSPIYESVIVDKKGDIKIINPVKVDNFSALKVVNQFDHMLETLARTFSKDGYLKRLILSTYENSLRGKYSIMYEALKRNF